MPVIKGTTNIGAIYKGTANIEKVYSGVNLVFQAYVALTAEGVPPLILINCLMSNLLDYKIYGNSTQSSTPTPTDPVEVDSVGDLVTDQSDPNYGKYKIEVGVAERLPIEYQEVDYIASTGSEYIDTELAGKSGYTMEAKLAYTAFPGTYSYFAGFGTNTSSRVYFLRVKYENGTALEGYTFDGTATASNDTVTLNTVYEYKSIMESGNQKIYRDGVLLKEGASTGSNVYGTIWLFGANYNGSINGNTNCKLYSCKFTFDGNVVGDYVPCYRKSDGEVGLFDLVTRKFFGNSGTGTLTKGSDVTNSSATFNIYLDEPLRKLGDYVDYIDFKNSKVVRNVGSYDLTGQESFTRYSTTNTYYMTSVLPNAVYAYGVSVLSNYYQGQDAGGGAAHTTGDVWLQSSSAYERCYFGTTYANLPDFTNFLTTAYTGGNPVNVLYPLTTATEESVTLPNISIYAGSTGVSVLTATTPSKIWIQYKGSN